MNYFTANGFLSPLKQALIMATRDNTTDQASRASTNSHTTHSNNSNKNPYKTTKSNPSRNQLSLQEKNFITTQRQISLSSPMSMSPRYRALSPKSIRLDIDDCVNSTFSINRLPK